MKTAVVAMAYGSPSRVEDIPAYYADIRGGRAVSAEKIEALTERYRRVGGSPLNEITEAQRAALERELELPVYAGMKHWSPWIADAARCAVEDGAERIVGLVLAPHYSRMSIGAYRAAVEAALRGRAELVFVERWGSFAPFVEYVADVVRGTHSHVVFTAHSLPARILDGGDPYRDELLESARLVAEDAALREWSFAFQSESPTGEPWLGPDILDHLEELHTRGIRDVLVCPIGFVSDHLEVRWDLDVEAAEKARELGLRFERTPMPNADARFVTVLASLAKQHLGVAV